MLNPMFPSFRTKVEPFGLKLVIFTQQEIVEASLSESSGSSASAVRMLLAPSKL